MDRTNDERSNLELLLRFAEFADVLDQAFADAGGRSVIKDNVSIFVMCSLELDGPKRPGEISILTGLSSGGVTKVVTRLENAGLVTRVDHALPQDRRAVTVALTAKGHELTGRFAHELALRRSETDLLVKELMRLTD